MPTPRPAAFEPNPLWQRAREPIFWLDPALKLAWVNRAWEELTGYPAATVIGLTCQAHGPTQAGDPSDLAASFHPPPESLAGRPAGGPTLIFRADGERLWRRVEFWPFCDERGELIGLLGIVRTEQDPPSVPESDAGRPHAELLEVRRRLPGAIRPGRPDRPRPRAPTAARAGPAGRGLVGARADRRRAGDGEAAGRPDDPPPRAGPPAAVHRVRLRGAAGGDPRARALRRGGPRRAGAGAFAASRRPRLSLGDGSTLLIDEVLSLPRDLQVRLVEALDSRVRLMATTAREPEAAVRDEQLRPELYYALTILVIRLFPLRDRRDELPTLAQHFLERANQRGGAQRSGFAPQALEALTAYDWPGNLPELARVVEHAHARAAGPLIAVDDLPATIRGNLGGAYTPPAAPASLKPLDELLTEVERRLIETALRQSRSNKSLRRRDPRHLPPAALSPDQGAQPPRRRCGRGEQRAAGVRAALPRRVSRPFETIPTSQPGSGLSITSFSSARESPMRRRISRREGPHSKTNQGCRLRSGNKGSSGE